MPILLDANIDMNCFFFSEIGLYLLGHQRLRGCFHQFGAL